MTTLAHDTQDALTATHVHAVVHEEDGVLVMEVDGDEHDRETAHLLLWLELHGAHEE